MLNVIVSHTFETEQQAQMLGYLTHALCLNGEADVRLNHQEFKLKKGDSFILRKSELGELLSTSDDFEIINVFVNAEFVELATPLSNYGMRGGMLLFQQPIMPLTDEQAEQLHQSMLYIEQCAAKNSHLFYRDMLLNAVQRMIIDFFDFHAALYGNETVTTPAAILMEGFLRLLEQGEFREHRELTYYADRLCVTSKYLSETVKKYSGYPANHWINRYTALDISRLLRNPNVAIQELTDMFGFSSVSHLNRYVKNQLGVNPNEVRK
ncbi:MAG: helix-turn-helix domain-containing protein [Paludibacteraceae bacterium]|nr:helix-turn-helix domain-containing protein [Paludibacteraceae bacterium]